MRHRTAALSRSTRGGASGAVYAERMHVLNERPAPLRGFFLMIGLLVCAGCQGDPRVGPDGQLLEACEVTGDEAAAYDGCRASMDMATCVDAGGTWTEDIGGDPSCRGTRPDTGCPCRDDDDCVYGACVTGGSTCAGSLGTCQDPQGCACHVGAGTEICVD